MKRFAALLPEKRLALVCAAAPLIICGLTLPAHAQVPGTQNTIANPGRVQDQLGEDLMIPQVSPNVDVHQMKLQGVPAGAEKIVFKFGGLRIDGATVYSQAELGKLYKDKIGQQLSLADVYGIANQMTLKYRNDGYVLTQVVVPPQTITGGVPRVQVVEGFVDKVIVQTPSGEGAQAVKTIKEYAGQIKGGPTNVKRLERQLLIINDLPGVHARSILSPSKTTKGGADLLVIVERKPYDAQLSVDNYGSRYLGPWQWGAAGTLNSVLGLNDAVSENFVITPEFDGSNELVYGSLGYEMPVGPYGTKVSVFGSITDTDPGFDLAPFDVHGRSDDFRIRAAHPFIRTRSTNLYGRLTFEARNVKSDNNLEPSRHDHIRALRAGLRYEFLDQLLGSVGFNVADLEVSKGIDVLGGSNAGDVNMTRPFADPRFTKAELELQRLHRLSENMNLLLQANGQLASDALLSSEEFGVGGINSGRGYDPSEIVGDNGISGRVEFQWKNPGNLQTKNQINQYVDKYQLYTFWDAGRVWNIDPTTLDQKRDSLTSVGAGVRVGFKAGVAGGVGVAFPMNRDVQTKSDKDPKVYMNLNKTF